jgi:hypothetical protein
MALQTVQAYLNDKAGKTGMTKQQAMNSLAGTTGLTLQDAANRYAGTTGLSIQQALIVKVGASKNNTFSIQEANRRL